MIYNPNPTPNLKNGAELLLKGGSLLNTSCNNCGGVQIRYKDRIICINCGLEVAQNRESDNIETSNPTRQNLSNTKEITNAVKTLDETISRYDKIILTKLSYLFTSLKDEEDILTQNIKVDLIIKYLDILERIQKS